MTSPRERGMKLLFCLGIAQLPATGEGRGMAWHLLVTVIKIHLAGVHSLSIHSQGVLLFGWFMETGSPSPALEDSRVIFSHTPPRVWKRRETRCYIS